MNSVPECAYYIGNVEERESELTPTEQCLYDMFARVYVETGNIYRTALKIGYKDFIAKERGNQIFNHGFTQRRIDKHKARTMEDSEQLALSNMAIRSLSQEMNNGDDPKNRIAAATNIFKIHHAKQVLNSTTSSLEDDRSAVMQVGVIPSVDEWEKEAVASQTLLKKQARE